MSEEKVILPKELTAENGAKALLMGEFFEETKARNPQWCADDCERTELADCSTCMEVDDKDKEEYFTQKVPVSWTTIKEIYKMIVKELSQPIEG